MTGTTTAYLETLVAKSKTPGIQYLVVDASRVLFEYDGGSANLSRRVPMDSGTTMMAYSMSKTITAAAALALVAGRKIGLDDPIAAYLDSIPYGARVTVRELLAHTSGIPNPIPLRWVHPAADHHSFDERAALTAILRRHPRLAFEPGTRYAYSNIGYWLLGAVIEKVSGAPFVAWATKAVLRKVGASPHELGYVIPDPARHAAGYLEKYSLLNLVKRLLIDRHLIGGYEGPWLRIQDHYPDGAAFGGLVGTALGFGKFLQDQLREHSRLFDDATRAQFYAQQRTTRGIPVPMTLGWHIGGADGIAFYFKEGGGGGFHCMMRVYPAARVATVVMANATGLDVKRLLDVLDRPFVRPAP